MNDKEQYLRLMQRYWEAETTAEEERKLSLYAANTDDTDFEDIRAVLGYLSIYRRKQSVPLRTVNKTWSWIAGIAAAAVIIFVGAMVHSHQPADALACMESTLTGIFSSGIDIEIELSDILKK